MTEHTTHIHESFRRLRPKPSPEVIHAWNGALADAASELDMLLTLALHHRTHDCAFGPTCPGDAVMGPMLAFRDADPTGAARDLMLMLFAAMSVILDDHEARRDGKEPKHVNI